ncbi:MAG: hypothetical protein OXQ94_14640 [Gemmatimonadota bacterium]|nr:hypothetical protein [Gemmatimonadota bacterium]MDE2872913.1 hypothetical protein [Gemmatimonadota bacterium]
MSDLLYGLVVFLAGGLGYALGRAHAHELFLSRFYRLIFWVLSTDFDTVKAVAAGRDAEEPDHVRQDSPHGMSN